MAARHPSWPCGNCARVYGTAFANYAHRTHCLRCGKQAPKGVLEKQRKQNQGAAGGGKSQPPWQKAKNRWADGPPASLWAGSISQTQASPAPAAQPMVDQATAKAMLETMVKAHGDDRKLWPEQAKSMVVQWDKAMSVKASDQPVDITKLTSFQLGQRLEDTNKKLQKSEERLKEREEEYQRALASRDAEKQILENHKHKKQQLEKAKSDAFLKEQASGAANPALQLCGRFAELQLAGSDSEVPEPLRGPMQALQQALEQYQKQEAEKRRAQQESAQAEQPTAPPGDGGGSGAGDVGMGAGPELDIPVPEDEDLEDLYNEQGLKLDGVDDVAEIQRINEARKRIRQQLASAAEKAKRRRVGAPAAAADTH
eukprot:8076798-Pyramimonas_sp.AAC.2